MEQLLKIDRPSLNRWNRAHGVHAKFLKAKRLCALRDAPEVFEPATELATTKCDDGIGAAAGPVHAGPLKASTDGVYSAKTSYNSSDALFQPVFVM